MSTYLQDYVIISDDAPSNKDIINFALFVDCDPLVYERATMMIDG